jgi:hypothetical protein
MTTRWGLVACGLLLGAVSSGCSDPPPTDVVVVLQSDLSVPSDTDGVQFGVVAGSFAPDANGTQGINAAAVLSKEFPVSVAFSAGRTTSFSMTVEILRGLADGTVMASIVVRRTITDIRFSAQRTMMLVLPMLSRCACQGTTCPTPGDPDCDNVVQPALQSFDDAVAPSTSFTNLGTIQIPPPPTGTH